MKDHKVIFEEVESTLISHSTLGVNKIREELEKFKHLEGKTFSDDEYYWISVYVVFYAGFRAQTVSSRLGVIRQHFPSFNTVADYRESDIERILGDSNMIRHQEKIRACVENAKVVRNIVREYGSFQTFILSFAPADSLENLMALKRELSRKFRRFRETTTYHFLTDIGMSVIKPDRVLCRIFYRLGLVESEGNLLEVVNQGRKFAQATGYPIRYIDIVFVAHGQVEYKDLGITKGICLKSPSCSICGARKYCNYPKQLCE